CAPRGEKGKLGLRCLYHPSTIAASTDKGRANCGWECRLSLRERRLLRGGRRQSNPPPWLTLVDSSATIVQLQSPILHPPSSSRRNWLIAIEFKSDSLASPLPLRAPPFISPYLAWFNDRPQPSPDGRGSALANAGSRPAGAE